MSQGDNIYTANDEVLFVLKTSMNHAKEMDDVYAVFPDDII
jgi:hypothetical protein